MLRPLLKNTDSKCIWKAQMIKMLAAPHSPPGLCLRVGAAGWEERLGSHHTSEVSYPVSRNLSGLQILKPRESSSGQPALRSCYYSIYWISEIWAKTICFLINTRELLPLNPSTGHSVFPTLAPISFYP